MSNKKKQAQEFRKAGAELPVFINHAIERHKMDGVELKEFSGWTPGTNQFNGETLEDAEKYIYQMPVQIGVNHSRRIKKIYQATRKTQSHEVAMAAVNEYMQGLADKLNKNNAPEESVVIDKEPKEKKKFFSKFFK